MARWRVSGTAMALSLESYEHCELTDIVSVVHASTTQLACIDVVSQLWTQGWYVTSWLSGPQCVVLEEEIFSTACVARKD